MVRRMTTSQKITFDVERATRLYESGLGLAEVGRQVGVSQPTVRKALLDVGVTMRRPGGQPRPFNVERAKRLYESGVSLRRVVELVGSTAGTVRAALVEAGVEIRPQRGGGRQPRVLDEQQVQQAKRLYESGKTVRELGGIFQVGRDTVWRALRDCGTPMRDVTAPRAKRLTSAKHAAISEQIRAGALLTEIKRSCRTTSKAVYEVAAEEGLQVQQMSVVDRDRVYRLRVARHTYASIAAITDSSISNVKRILDSFPPIPHMPRQPRVRRRWSRAEHARAVRMRERGRTYQEIADALGRTVPSVAGVLQKPRRR
jgi:transposase